MKVGELEFGELYKEDSRNGIWKTSSFIGRGTAYVKMNELFSKKFITSEGNYELIELDDREKQKLLLKPNDLLFSRTSVVPEGVGKCSIIMDLKDDLAFDSNIIRVRLEESKCNPKYIFYHFNSHLGRGQILSLANGAAVKTIKGSDLKKLKINILPFSTQRKIASILSAYDDLIENNLKRIKLLEEKAFLSYKQIVREEKMEVEDKLENLIQTVKRKAKIPKADYIEKGDFPIIDQSTDFIGGYTNEKEAVYEHLPMIVFGDHTRILKYINFPFACGADGTQLVKPENPSISVAYLYFELISCNLSNYHYARHFKFLKEQVIKLPSEKVMLEYKEETDKVFNLIQLLRLQNTKLREARDILLPKLMNGQIEV